jgi:hypothetical protein
LNRLLSALPHPQLEEHEEFLRDTQSRLEEVDTTLLGLEGSVEESWIEAMTLFGVTTSYIVLDSGLLRVKLEGSLDELPILEQVLGKYITP